MITTNKLVDALQVEQLDCYLFRGFTPRPTLPRVFGGQVMAQAMNAASRTVDNDRDLHSFHSYFLRPGNPDKQIIYDVDPIRDGGSFTTRRVVAKQDGQAIYNCSLSFMKHEEGYHHEDPMPDVAPPDDLETEQDFVARLAAMHSEDGIAIPYVFPEIDIRRLDRVDPVNTQKVTPAVRDTWIRFKPELDNDCLLHKTLLAYFSDIGLMLTALIPHGVSMYNKMVMTASLDHGMWFHAPCNVNEWVLYRTESHWANNGRGLNIGKFFRQDGTLVASTIQEGLMRPLRK